MVSECIPLPLVSLRLNGELTERLVSCEPSPINAVAVTEPATFVVPSNSTVNASLLLSASAPFHMTKAVFEELNSAPLAVTADPNKLK